MKSVILVSILLNGFEFYDNQADHLKSFKLFIRVIITVFLLNESHFQLCDNSSIVSDSKSLNN